MNDLFSSTENSKPRILLVENDPLARVSYQSLLMEWNYTPILAMGTGATLQADAKAKALDYRCALALIDLRLVDDDDDEDISGLVLAEELQGRLHPIILSGYDNQSVLRNMMQNHKDIPFIAKHDRRNEFQKMLDAEAAKACASKRGLIIEHCEILNDLMVSDLGKQMGEYSDQIADVFARLFPKATKLRLEKLNTSSYPSNFSTAPRPNSTVLIVYEDDFAPYVVKIARAEKILKEAGNYLRYIARRPTEHFSARLDHSTALWDIGGVSYSYMNNFDIRSFSIFYEEKEISDIEEILGSFFKVIWGQYYYRIQDAHNVSLYQLYTNVWEKDWYTKRIQVFSPADFTRLEGIFKNFNLPQPIEWFKEKIAESSSDITIINTTRTAITHGDLHGDNLMVDNKKNVWVIDFERCGEGHALQDFIELEADIFNRLEAHNVNSRGYFKMCVSVLKQKKIETFEDSEITSEDPRIEKALKTISIIRSLARQCTEIADAREYLFGLLFNTLFHAALVHKRKPNSGELPLLLAGFICHRLEHWDETWPPANWDF